jgi:hypothetical protein
VVAEGRGEDDGEESTDGAPISGDEADKAEKTEGVEVVEVLSDADAEGKADAEEMADADAGAEPPQPMDVDPAPEAEVRGRSWLDEGVALGWDGAACTRVRRVELVHVRLTSWCVLGRATGGQGGSGEARARPRQEHHP